MTRPSFFERSEVPPIADIGARVPSMNPHGATTMLMNGASSGVVNRCASSNQRGSVIAAGPIGSARIRMPVASKARRYS